MKSIAVSVIAALLAACQDTAPKTYADLEREYALKDLQTHPVGRYHFIEKQVFPDGSVEYSCLDTATGEIGYASIPSDPKSADKADFNCSH